MNRCGHSSARGGTAAAVILVAFFGEFTEAALSVLPHQSDGIVVQLRSTILLDDKDLFGPTPVTTCSSMDDGPFCEQFGSLPDWRDADMRARSVVSSEMILAAGDYSAHSVVDGVLSQRLRARNVEAFDWSSETQRTFSSLVSRVVGDSLGKGAKGLVGTSSTRSGAQTFRFQFSRLRPWWRRVPESFSDGLPASLGASWSGVWSITAGSRGELVGSDLPPWKTCVSLETSVGYLRFKTQVVVRKLVLSVLSKPETAGGCLVCGRLNGKERWCSALDHLAAGSPYVDVGNSFYAVDEVAIVAAPPEGITIHLVEVAATVPSRLHGEAAERKVVLLKRLDSKQGLPSKLMEPAFTTVSRDAPFWDLNEVVQQNMLLRTPPLVASVAAVVLTSKKEGSPSATIFNDVSGFLEMLQSLKNGSIKAPAGVTLTQLKKEMAVLVASTKEIQDDDVLLHSKIDSLLQQRVREKGLDGLLALQAEWGRRDTQDVQRDTDRADVHANDAWSATPSATVTTTLPAASTPSELWGDDIAEAMQLASADLEKKSIEAREKRKKDNTIEFQMESGEGTIEVRVVGGEKLSQRSTRSLGSIEVTDDEDSEDGGPKATLEDQLENLLGPLRSTLEKHVEQMLETATRTRSEENSDEDDSDEDSGSASRDVKIEVQVLNMDEDGGFNSEELAQMMQSMLQGDGSGVDMEDMMQSMFQTDESESGVFTGAMEAIMQALQQQGQAGGNDADDDSDVVDMDGL